MGKRAAVALAAAFITGTAWAETPVVLDSVTVTATRTEHTEAEAPASVTVISAEEIRAKGATNILEAIRDVPGITLGGRQVGGRKTLTIRGAEDRHTLVLVNGRRISSTDDVVGHSDYQYGWVSMDQVERIEVVRGPMSALYGSEAMGGVVNIITRTAGDRWQGGATLRGDQTFGDGGDGHQMAVSAAGPLGGGFGLAFSVDQLRQSEVPLPENGQLTEIEGQRRHGASVDLTYEPADGHEFALNLLENREKRWRGNQESSGARRYYEDVYHLVRSQQSLGYRGEWGSLRPEIRYSRTAFDVTNHRTLGIAPTRPQSLRDDALHGSLLFPLGESHLFTAGGEYRREELRNAGLIGGEDAALHRALYLQDEIALTESLGLTLGGRADDHEIFGNEFSPRAYLVWKVTPSLIVKGGYGQAFRAPTLKQISPSYVGAEGPHTFSGNAAIRPETSESFEIGVDWRQGGRTVTATLFRNDIDDLIYTRLINQIGPRRFYIYDNISRARLQGAETAVTQALGGGFLASAGYMFLDATDRDTGAELTGRPRHSVNGSLAWEGGPWTAALAGEYVGEQSLEGTGGTQRVPGYPLVHLSGSYQVHEHARLRAGLRNLTDMRLAEESPLYGYAERGRMAYLAIDASF